MSSTNIIAPSAIVPEFLTKDNYEDWVVWLRNYLLGEELWEIVDGTEPIPQATQPQYKTWRKKNAQALHAIQITCGADMFSHIKQFDVAKPAWDHLASIHQSQTEQIKLLPQTEASPGPEGDAPHLFHSASMGQCPSASIQMLLHSCQMQNLTSATHNQAPVHPTQKDNLREDNVSYLPLYKAVDDGDWESAKRFLDDHPDAVRARITATGTTALLVASMNGNVVMVEKLLQLMSAEDMELKDIYGNTALSRAAMGGITKIVEAMVNANRRLVCLRNNFDCIPVVMAAIYGRKDTVRFLYSVTPDVEFNPQISNNNGAILLTEAIRAEIYDVALNLLRRYPRLAITQNNLGDTVLTALSRRPSAFPSGSRHGIWRQWVYSFFWLLHRIAWSASKPLGIHHMHQKEPVHIQVIEILKVICSEIEKLDEAHLLEAKVYFAVVNAAKFGIVEIVDEIIRSIPNAIYTADENGRNIVAIAIVHRQHKVFNLIYGMGPKQSHITPFDNQDNSLLHLAAMLSPYSQLSRVSGAALQMQRELQWYKEVGKFVPPVFAERINKNGQIPPTLFTEQHKDLVKEGETWMKGTASSCTVVAALIATIMFTAAFTVPGGNNSDTGIPIFLHRKAFMIFIISDAFSLFSSSASMLMFLGILTSRYAEEDFLVSLPKRLIIGLATLFFSVATMMIAFGATLFIVLHHRAQWTAIPITLLGSVPVALFVLLQFPLLVDMVVSTYGSGIFGPGR
uniref:PGG domain-containing protein n=1 Tax=Nelumbo nucifera TaxID=4432 RepID=A0A822XUM8_NELNU|nr:TPA_asm: hypothetical protein HUJ06_024079 [Nelumbo nucifera]